MHQARKATLILIATLLFLTQSSPLSETRGSSRRQIESDMSAMQLEFSRDFRGTLPTHILIYNYGKVASSSQQVAFGELTHSGRLPQVNDMNETYPPGFKTHNSLVARDFIEKLPTGSSAWVITAVRNRFLRDIAAYFQKFNHVEFEEKMRNKTVGELQEDFRGRHQGYVDEWFQRDFFTATNVDLLSHAGQMDTQNYVYVERDLDDKRINFLLVRFEDIGKWNEIFGSFFTGFELPESNAVASGYEDKYVEFVNTYTFSEQEISNICNGDTMRFYSASEISEMAPQCSNSQAMFHGTSGQQPRNHVSVANNGLRMYDADLDLDPNDD